MKKYHVIWTEKMAITIEAKSKAEAKEKVLSGEYDEKKVSSEEWDDPEVYELTK